MSVLLHALLLAVVTAADGQPVKTNALPRTITFDSSGPASSVRLALADVAPDFPRIGPAYEALVLEMRASSPQRFSLDDLYRAAPQANRRSAGFSCSPIPARGSGPQFPYRCCRRPPTSGHDMAAVGNRSRAGYFLGLWGPFAR